MLEIRTSVGGKLQENSASDRSAVAKLGDGIEEKSRHI